MTDWVNLTNTNDTEDDSHALTLVGKVLSDKKINFTAINAILSTSWDMGPNVQITALDQNVVSCSFTYLEDRDRILGMGPWAVKGFVLNLLRWPPHLHLDEINFSSVLFGSSSIIYP